MTTTADNAERRAKLSTAKQALLEKRLHNALFEGAGRSVIQRRANPDELPLSFSQERIWMLCQLDPDSPVYNRPVALRLKGSLHQPALERALDEILHRHEVLRCVYPLAGDQPAQIILPSQPIHLSFIDLSRMPELEREAYTKQLATQEAQRVFDLSQGLLLRATLMRLKADEHILMLNFHHISFDAWSVRVLVDEFSALYEAYVEEKPSPLPELPIQYADFAAWQRGWLQGKILEEQLTYWVNKLAGVLSRLELPIDHPRLPKPSFRGGSRALQLNPQVVNTLKDLSRQQGVTLFMTLLAVFQTLLFRYTGQADLIVATPVAGRSHVESEQLIGCFINTLILRGDLSGNPSFSELLNRTRQMTLEALAHQELPFERLVQELNPDRNTSSPLIFQVLFNFENLPHVQVTTRGLVIEEYNFDTQVTDLDLTLDISSNADGGLTCTFGYNADLFEGTFIQRMADHYVVLLQGILAHPEQEIGKLPLLTYAELQQMLVEWNDTGVDNPLYGCVHQYFEIQAARDPEAVALVFQEQRLAYGELNERANRLGHFLQKIGVKTETLVAICMERSIEMVVGLMGVLKAGGAFVPLDPDYPPERLAFILDEIQAPVLLTQQHLVEKLEPAQTRIISLDTDWTSIVGESAKPPVSAVSPHNLAYVIYTSGSTGVPKGVMIEHHSLCNHTDWMHRAFQLNPTDRVLQNASLSFDVSISEILDTLLLGAQVLLAKPQAYVDLTYLVTTIAVEKVTVIQVTPSLLRALVEESNFKQCSSLRLIICGGEEMPEDLPPAVFACLDTVLYNSYGPTEACIDATYWKCSIQSENPAISIGRPISNTTAYILDQNLEPVPVGVTGELCIGGEGLARGYFKRPDLTDERFIPNPFAKLFESTKRVFWDKGVWEQRNQGEEHGLGTTLWLYRTGDLVKYQPDGNIMFVGRIDLQVKLRGFRVELGEVEFALQQHPAIKQAAVQACPNGTGDKRLVAYIVPKINCNLTSDELRRFLQNKLPEYMVPSAFVILQTLPLTPSGKVDRKALPLPEVDRIDTEHIYTAPRDPLEKRLAEIWSDVLGIEQVGIFDNFFELGGHSLLAIRLLARIERDFRRKLSLAALFEFPTISGIAAVLHQHPKENLGSSTMLPLSNSTDQYLCPLSTAQESLWFLETLVGLSDTYNVAVAFQLSGPLNIPALEKSLNLLVARHASLRTRIVLQMGEPRQQIIEAVKISMPVMDYSALPPSEAEAEATRLARDIAHQPFNLTDELLYRFCLICQSDQNYLLVINLHHMICDEESMAIFFHELSLLYRAVIAGETPSLPDLYSQYVDYVNWQEDQVNSPVYLAQLAYWKQKLNNAPLALDLPFDHPRTGAPSFLGDLCSRFLSEDQLLAARGFSQKNRIPFSITLLAIFQILLYHYTNQEDLLVGVPAANRNQPDFKGLIGYLANPLPIRGDLSGDPTFRQFLARLHQTIREALANQELPFDRVVEELRPQRDPSRNPFFQVMFYYHETPWVSLELPGMSTQMLELDTGSGKFDLTLFLDQDTSGLKVKLTYRSDLFEPATIERMLDHFQALLAVVVDDPDQPISFLPQPEENAHRLGGIREKSLPPLSIAQQQLWFLDQLNGPSNTYNESITFHLEGPLDVQALQQALNLMIERHETLRTAFTREGVEARQLIAPDLFIEIPVVDLTSLPALDRNEEALRLANEVASQPFNLLQAPLFHASLFRLGNQEHIFLLTFHHAIYDGWSDRIFQHDLSLLYSSIHSGQPVSLPELTIQYADFATRQRKQLESHIFQTHIDYWMEKLSGAPATMDLPADHPRPTAQSFRGAACFRTLPLSMLQALRSLSQSSRLTLYTTLLAAFQTLLYRYSGLTDFCIGSLAANRSQSDVQGLIGFFANMLIMRADLSGNLTFRQLLSRVGQTVLEAFDHQEVPFELLVEKLNPERDLSHNPLIQVTFAYLPIQDPPLQYLNLAVTHIKLEKIAPKFDLSFFLEETPAGLMLRVEYSTDLFEAPTIERMIDHFQTLLIGIVNDPDQPIASLKLLTEAERRQMLVEWNNTSTDYPLDGYVHQIFEAQVERTPEAVAVVYDEGQLTYSQLNERANQLAHYLLNSGVRPDVFVGICMERSLEMVIALLAVLKAGAAYVPIDPTYPQTRLHFMLQDAQVPVLITQERFAKRLQPGPSRIVCLDTDWETITKESPANPSLQLSPQNLAYMIYTSGSTGTPKGAMIPHQALVNHMLWMQEAFPLDEKDKVLQKTPFSFDASVWEFYAPFTAGAQLVMAAPEGHKDINYLVDEINRQEITILQTVPSMLRLLVDDRRFKSCSSLRRIFCGGEPMPVDLPGRLFEVLNVELVNLYGPAEACIDTTAWVIPQPFNSHSVPIGKAISNVRIYILDQNLQPVPVGIPGELCIGGVSLARGYLNQPELNAEKFIHDPFIERSGINGEVKSDLGSVDKGAGDRLYKTGDLARYLPDGIIEFIGRIDQQVKIRGFRVELGEIESLIDDHPAVKEAVVLACEYQPGDNRLAAYVVLRPDESITEEELYNYLKTRLPDYMIPSVVMFLETLPLNPSGKVDRKALPLPEWVRLDKQPAYTLPKTALEQVLVKIWADVLGIDQIGIYENFFDLGGHSLSAIQVIARISDVLLIQLPLSSIFKAPTVAEFKEMLVTTIGSEKQFEKIAELVLGLPDHPDL